MSVWSRLRYCALVTVAGVTAAAAGDIPVSEPIYYRPPPPPVLFSWTGCYLGGHIGGAVADNQITGTFLGPAVGNFAAVTLTPIASQVPISFGSNGFLIGGQLGCQYQFASRLVIGFEVDAAWANVSGGSRQTVNTAFNGPLLLTPTAFNSDGNLASKSDFVGTATARFGYAIGPIGQGLIYGKAGAAWITNRYDFTGQAQSAVCTAQAVNQTLQPAVQCLVTVPGTVPFNFTGRETRVGWTIGAGVEWAMWGNFTIKGEYNYLDFGTRTVTVSDAVLGSTNVSVRQYVSEFKIGGNYRFGVPLPSSY